MIMQYRFAITSDEAIHSSVAYPLYAWLLQQADPVFGEMVHKQGETPIAQHVVLRKDKEALWVVTLLGRDAVTELAPVLDAVEEIRLNQGNLIARPEGKTQFTSAEEFILFVRSQPYGNRIMMQVQTVTSFKQGGRYVLFPQERLLLQSLIAKWNAVFPDYPMQDEDAFSMLEEGIRIVDYRLRSLRYPMKATRIPGFIGQLVISARLSAPMMELWHLLAAFAPYCGVGIKTALGMGGVSVEWLEEA